MWSLTRFLTRRRQEEQEEQQGIRQEQEGIRQQRLRQYELVMQQYRVRQKNQLRQQQTEVITPSRTIPSSVKMYVWRRDGGRCVECGSREKLEYDHIIPVSKGGSNTERNVQLLCEHCNRKKQDKIM